MVVNNVENHFEAVSVERVDHRLEFANLRTWRLVGGVGGVWREEAQTAVTPVVLHASCCKSWFGCKVMNRKQTNAGDPK